MDPRFGRVAAALPRCSAAGQGLLPLLHHALFALTLVAVAVERPGRPGQPYRRLLQVLLLAWQPLAVAAAASDCAASLGAGSCQAALGAAGTQLQGHL